MKDQSKSLELSIDDLSASLNVSNVFKQLLDDSTDLVQCVNPSGIVVFANRAWRETLGFDTDSLETINIFDIIQPDSLPHCRSTFERLMAGDLVNDFAASFVTKNGSVIHLEGRAAPIFGAGEVIGTQAIMHDVTEYRATGAALDQLASEYKNLINMAAIWVATIDRSGAVTKWNPQAAIESGIQEKDALGRNILEIIVPEKLWLVAQQELDKVFRGDSVTGAEMPIHPTGGTKVWLTLSVSPITGSNDEVVGAILIGTNITARKLAERRLRVTTAQVTGIAEIQRDIIADKNVSGAFTHLLEMFLYDTHSDYGFVGRVRYDDEGAPYLHTSAITNIAWDAASQKFYDEHKDSGFEFRNLKTLFGECLTSGELVIANEPSSDPRSGGLPPGHPALNSFVAMPIHKGTEFIGMVGLGNRPGGYTLAHLHDLDPLLTAAGTLLTFLTQAEETKAAEHAKFKAQRDLRIFLDAPTVVTVSTDDSGRITDCNRAFANSAGTTPKDVIGEDMFQLFPERVREQLREIFSKTLAEGSVLNFPLPFKTPTEVRWILWNAVARDEDVDERAGFIAVGIDITERKLAEDEANTRQRRVAAQQAAITHILTSPAVAQGDLTEAARVITETAGQTMEVGRSGIWLLSDDHREIECLDLFELASGAHTKGMTFKRETFPAYFEAFLAERTIVAHDASIDPRTRPFQETYLKPLGISSMLDASIIASGRTIGVLCLEHLGEPRRWNDQEVVFAGQLADAMATATINRSRTESEENLKTERASLTRRVAERTEDLSSANAELAAAARAKDQFLATMSHELRTPLNAILATSESLQEAVYGELKEQQEKPVELIEESGRHLLELINDILDLAKVEAGTVDMVIEPVVIQDLIETCLRFIKEPAMQKRLLVETAFDKRVVTLQADGRRLKQILVNLLSNAVKFTPEGGTVGLEVAGDVEDETVRITVWDTGIGIRAEDQPQLFRSFVQLDAGLDRKYSGTGLGLALVARMVELHGGSVTVASEGEGHGSRFTVALPWTPAVPEPEPADDRKPAWQTTVTAPPGDTPPGGSLILLAEDNEANIGAVTDYLQAKGYRLVVARNGREAVELARERRPDLILMDIQMPEMDGLEATRQIREDREFANTPIIALTALAMTGDRERCLAAGMDEYLSKPVSLRNLNVIIYRLLKRVAS